MNNLIIAATRKTLGVIANSGRQGGPIEMTPDAGRFLIAFCGSGTGHMTQSVAFCRMMQARGLSLAGVITDSDMAQSLVDEVITPLGVPLLVLPAITIVTKKGVLPPHRVLANARVVDLGLKRESDRIRSFLAESRAGLIINMWQISLGVFIHRNALPRDVRVMHIAAQCSQARGATTALRTKEMPLSPMAAAAKGTVEVMCAVFASSGTLVPISASGADGTLAPIIDLPEPVSPECPPLILCYFLTQAPARQLERMLHKQPLVGVEVHCFTPEALKPPRGRPLSLHSHAKQRGLFVELFGRCTAVLCSTGNETIWEAVCRGVPVLTLPTSAHGEQILNAVVHSRALPHLVRTRSSLSMVDVTWLSTFEHSEATRRESAALRERCAALAASGGLDAFFAKASDASIAVEVSP